MADPKENGSRYLRDYNTPDLGSLGAVYSHEKSVLVIQCGDKTVHITGNVKE